MPALNFVIAIIIGFIIGLVTQLIMEVLYFRGWRRQVRDDRLTQLEGELAARDEHLAQLQVDVEMRDARIVDLESRLARGQERLNVLQRDVALQRQRTQVAAEAEALDEVAAVPPPIGDVTDPGGEAPPGQEVAASVDARDDADDESPPTTWLD